MSMTLAEVERAMLALDQRDIAALVHRGIQALDHSDEDEEENQEVVDAVWRDELTKRIDDIQSGRVKTVPVEEVFASARAALEARRG